ncbi:MAG: NAD(+) synthase [Planctomycetota bacterium]
MNVSDHHRHGFYRVTVSAPEVSVANPAANAKETVAAACAADDSDLIVFPELGLSGYSCGDLFASQSLLNASLQALARVAGETAHLPALLVVGLPLRVVTSLMNVAAVVHGGRVLGIVPKTFLPNYREFYEQRHFQAASPSDPKAVFLGENTSLGENTVPFGTDLLFAHGEAVVSVEICEDLWVPIPPSCEAAMAGANVIANLSASNETIGKAQWRRDLVVSQSGRLIAGYAYASAAAGESTSDLVFGGHGMIAENGTLLGESRRVGDGGDPIVLMQTDLTRDIDIQRLAHDRRVVGSFDDWRGSHQPDFRRIEAPLGLSATREERLCRFVDPHPFVPSDDATREERCAEIIAIQTAGLVKRLTRLPEELPLAIGVSGGLDSTLALMVAVQAVNHLKRDPGCIHGLLLPGFGTTTRTFENAKRLTELLGITQQVIDTRELALSAFRCLDHAPLGLELDDAITVETLQESLQALPDDARDLVFENVQARLRTFLLMSRGFVLGTGDLSEQALGWSTYNGDHMSMYNVNASVPKTLVRDLVKHAAEVRGHGELSDVLIAIAETPITPELLPPSSDGSIRQNTEETVGPYELHDFFLYHFVRGGCGRSKLLYLAKAAVFHQSYSDELIERTLDTFLRRFFQNQFKRNCVPDGPKVGSVSLSPRGDWRMPADADVDAFLEEG